MITACIASVPERENLLKQTYDSLIKQVDRVYVSLNNYTYIPEFLDEKYCVLLDNSTGDAAKFYFIEQLEGYIFTCDDDLFYPNNYVEYMISGIKKYNAVVTLHGRIYSRPITSFLHTITRCHCLGDVDFDVKVDTGGTGVMAWHSDRVKIKYDYFKSPNMADLWMGKYCYENNIPVWCLAHRDGWLKYLHPEKSIWEIEKEKEFIRQTELLKTFLK